MKLKYSFLVPLALAMVIGLSPHAAHAKSVQWSSAPIGQLFRFFNGTNYPGNVTRESNWSLGLDNSYVSVTYLADVVNLTAGGVPLADNSQVEVGSRLRFRFYPHHYTHLFWFGTGYMYDSPYGDWVNNAGPPVAENVCRDQDYVSYANSGSYGKIYAYVPLSVNPPSKTITGLGNNLSCNSPQTVQGFYQTDCTVTAPGPLQPNFTFNNTYGKFYYRYSVPGYSCYGDNTPMRTGTVTDAYGNGNPDPSDFILQIPSQTISFTLTAVPKPQCKDGKDNDGDGKVDSADPGCHLDGFADNPLSFNGDDNDETDPLSPPPTSFIPLPSTSLLFSKDGGATWHTDLTGSLAVAPGQEISVRLQYDNQGGQAGTGASLSTTLPAGFSHLTSPATTNCLTPSGSETVCNTDAGQGGALQDSALWSGPTLTVAPTAGLYDLSGGLTVGYLEIGKKRYLNFQDCDYLAGSNTDDTVSFSPGNSAGHITCGGANLRPAQSLFQAADTLAKRYGNFQNCDYLAGSNTDDAFGLGPSNTAGHFTCGPGGGGATLRSAQSLFTTLDHLGKRYLNFQDCDYLAGSNTDDVVGFSPSNTPGRFTCSAGGGGATIRLSQSLFQPLDLLDTTRGQGSIEFHMQASRTPGLYTQSASLTGTNFNNFRAITDAGQIEVKNGSTTPTATPTVTVSPTATSTATPTPQCSDGIDNDGDGKIDTADPGCHASNDPSKPYNPTDNDESNTDIGGIEETD